MPARWLVREWRRRQELSCGHQVLVLMLVAVSALQSADRSTVGATAALLHRHLGLSHGQIGALASISSVVGVVATVPCGIVADRRPRVRLLRWPVLLWAAGMCWVGLTWSFASMLPARALLGAGDRRPGRGRRGAHRGVPVHGGATRAGAGRGRRCTAHLSGGPCGGPACGRAGRRRFVSATAIWVGIV